MSELVGTPEDRFSRIAAHSILTIFAAPNVNSCNLASADLQSVCSMITEPSCEKTNNLDSRSGPTQTRLYSHRK